MFSQFHCQCGCVASAVPASDAESVRGACLCGPSCECGEACACTEGARCSDTCHCD
jgi:hypothetical protein